MGRISYAIDCFEESAKLISQNNPNKSMFAVILIDALVDMYSQYHMQREYHRIKFSMNLRRTSNLENSDLNDKLIAAEDACNKFDERFNWFAQKQILSVDEAASIKILHEYRNQYLHRLKQQEDDCIAFSKLFFYLFEKLFVAIPIDCISGSDLDAPLIKKLNKKTDCFSREFLEEIVKAINKKYNLCFSKEEFLKILSDFLLKQYEYIIYSLHFIIDASNNRENAISMIENECKAGKVVIDYYGEEDDPQFSCTTTKCQHYLGKIRKMLTCSNENEGLQIFTQLYESLNNFSYPIHKKATEIDEYIQLQVDIMRGK